MAVISVIITIDAVLIILLLSHVLKLVMSCAVAVALQMGVARRKRLAK